MRLLGVDWGTRRIGIAVGVVEGGIVSPRPAVQASGKLATDAERLLQIARVEEAGAIILGLPLFPDGAESPNCRIIRMLGSQLEGLGATVILVPEAYTSSSAEQVMREAGYKGSQIRRHVDAEAACQIVERYLRSDETQASP